MKLGKYLSIERNNLINIEANKTYTVAGVKNYGKGIVNKKVIKGSELTMKKYQMIKSNQLMWCKVDTKNGAFGITKKEHEGSLASTNMCLANIKIFNLNPDFLQLLFTNEWFYNAITKKSTGTTNRQYLTPSQLFEVVEIPDFDIQEQEEFLKRYRSLKESGLFEELVQQETYLQLLRQSILQEAVQGKLSVQNPSDEDAATLLKRIKAEKQKLIKEGKLKKEKELPTITEDEVSFELPKGWVWSRLKELGFITGGGTPSTSNNNFWNGNIPWITPKDMKSDLLSDGQDKITMEGIKNSSAKLIPRNSILIVGRSGILKRMLPVCINEIECAVNQDLKVIVPYIKEMARYIQLMLQGHEEFILKKLVKYGMTVHSLMYQEFEMQPFPLPPLAEQQRIVAKVNKLQQQLNQLESQVGQSREYAEQLLQAVLKEAFEKKGTVYEENEMLSMVAEE